MPSRRYELPRRRGELSGLYLAGFHPLMVVPVLTARNRADYQKGLFSALEDEVIFPANDGS